MSFALRKSMGIRAAHAPGITTVPFTANTTWTVPTGVTSITVRCWGAGGTDGEAGGYWPDEATNYGGAGGFSKATVTVTPGETLYIGVGTYNGLNGGGAGGEVVGAYGGNGGGYTGVYRSSLPTQANVLVMAGGGGGGGAAGSDDLGVYARFGTGGNAMQTSSTPFRGGTGGSVWVEYSYSAAGGGGGGGYYGGGGGVVSQDYGDGGAGGTARVTGSSTFTYQGLYTSDSFYNSSYGASGQNGYLVITY